MQKVILPEGKSWNEIIVELEKRRDKEQYALPTRFLVQLGRRIANLWPWKKASERWAGPHKPSVLRWTPPTGEE